MAPYWLNVSLDVKIFLDVTNIQIHKMDNHNSFYKGFKAFCTHITKYLRFHSLPTTEIFYHILEAVKSKIKELADSSSEVHLTNMWHHLIIFTRGGLASFLESLV